MAKTSKKTPAKTPAAKSTGYKGHRAGSNKEKIHQLFDKFGADKAYPMACKLVAESTVNTSFSQFRAARDKK